MTYYMVGKEVRAAIEKIGGTPSENIPHANVASWSNRSSLMVNTDPEAKSLFFDLRSEFCNCLLIKRSSLA